MTTMAAASFRTPHRLLQAGTWIWLAIAAATGVAGLMGVYREPERVAVEEFSAVYGALGLGDTVMITLFLALPFAFAITVGCVMASRRGRDRGALVLATGLVALYHFVSGSTAGLDTMWLRHGVASVTVVLIIVFLVSFPTGTFRPRISILVPLLVIVFVTIEPELAFDTRTLLGSSAAERSPEPYARGAFFWLVVLGLAVIVQAVRDRRHSDEAERHQSRWVAVGIVSMMLPPAVLLFLNVVQVSTPEIVGLAFGASSLGSYVLPITLAIAVFRYHLYDIDRLISRTVSYGLVAGAIASVYAVPVVLFPSMVESDSDLFVAGATLLAAGLFNPLRRRIQRWTDARFDRSRYDAEREIDELGSRLRDEIRPFGVVGAMTEVIDRTLAPVGLAVWIRQGSDRDS